jgi:glutamine synthetase
VRFLIFLAAVLKAVHKHAGLLRAGIASSGNEHRLGANEAPPAIISVFMGETLTRLIEDIGSGKEAQRSAEQQLLRLGVAKLPEVMRDNTDRNRTSPFAFTGAKFEFRAVGGSQSIAFPIMILNAAVAEAIGELTAELREVVKTAPSVEKAVLEVVSTAFRETESVRFEGNNYSEDWVKEAEQRGLLNLRHTAEALEELVTDHARALLTGLGILSESELESRFHVRMERYVKDVLIELHTLHQIADTMVLPAAYQYAGQLASAAAAAKAAGITVVPQVEAANEIGRLINTLQERRTAMVAAIQRAEGMHDELVPQAEFLTHDGRAAMAAVREACDALELVLPDELWPLPKYREMLFPV